VEDKNGFTVAERFLPNNTNAAMSPLLNGTSYNRTGICAYRINKENPTKALTKTPKKAPTNVPTKAPMKAPSKTSFYCTRTLSGVFGRWLGFCQSE
jgi:hypothetical protein